MPIATGSLLKGPPSEEERRVPIQLYTAPAMVYDSPTEHPFLDFVDHLIF
jgi:hypothetical protein